MKAILLTEEELATLRIPADRPPPRILLGMEGGVIQGYSTNGQGVEVTIIDYDEDFDDVRQADGSVSTAGVYQPVGKLEPEWVDTDFIIEDEAA